MWTRGQSTTLMECALHVLPCILDELLPALELRPCWEERWNFETAVWHMDGWRSAWKKQTKRLKSGSLWIGEWRTSSRLQAHLWCGVVAFDNDRTVGWSHARHLEVVPQILADGSAASDASRYDLCGFLVGVRCDRTPTDLESKCTRVIQILKLMCSRGVFFSLWLHFC